MLKCDLCKKEFPLLTPFDFKNLVWTQQGTFQLISANELLKTFEIDLCYSCRHKVFDTSVPCILFRKDLFEALRDKKVVKKEGWF